MGERLEPGDEAARLGADKCIWQKCSAKNICCLTKSTSFICRLAPADIPAANRLEILCLTCKNSGSENHKNYP